jgi:hypothetical protein
MIRIRGRDVRNIRLPTQPLHIPAFAAVHVMASHGFDPIHRCLDLEVDINARYNSIKKEVPAGRDYDKTNNFNATIPLLVYLNAIKSWKFSAIARPVGGNAFFLEHQARVDLPPWAIRT